MSIALPDDDDAEIEMTADIAKQGVDYGVSMAGIGVGALSEILLPNGMPEWLADVDPLSFLPNLDSGGS